MCINNVALLLAIVVCAIFGTVENRSLYGIGTRIINDQLLLKDILECRPSGIEQRSTVTFNYSVPEPITCIEILSDENVLADVSFSYQDDLVMGTITAANATISNFEAVIKIYGFHETMLNVNPSLIINRDQQFSGKLEPVDYESSMEEEHYDDDDDDDHNYVNMSDEALDSELLPNEDMEPIEDMDGFNNELDKIIDLGQRQKGDYLIYETYQTSVAEDAGNNNQSVTFYYIDINFITYVRFTLYEYFADKTVKHENSAVAEYTHYSPRTLKAVITDYDTKFLFVQMSMYGYKPDDLPLRDYVPYLHESPQISQNGRFMPIVTESPMSLYGRLKAVMENKELDSLQDDNEDEDEDNGIEAALEKKSTNNQSVVTSIPSSLLLILGLAIGIRLWQN